MDIEIGRDTSVSQNRQVLDDIAEHVKEIVNAETVVVALAESEGEDAPLVYQYQTVTN